MDPTVFQGLTGVLIPAAFVFSLARGAEPSGERARLVVTPQELVLELPGEAPRRFASASDLFLAAPGARGEFRVEAGEDSLYGGAPQRGEVSARPDRVGRKIRMSSGEITVEDLAAFLADYTGLPVLHDSSQGILARKITLASPIDAADDAVARKILEVHRIRVREKAIAEGKRALILEPMDAPAGAEEPEARPIVVVDGESGGSRRGAGSAGTRTATGPEGRPNTYSGVTLERVPEVVQAQVDLAEGRGVFITEVDVEKAKTASEVAPLRRYDIITHVNEAAVSAPDELVRELALVAAGGEVRYRILRKGWTRLVTVKKGR